MGKKQSDHNNLRYVNLSALSRSEALSALSPLSAYAQLLAYTESEDCDESKYSELLECLELLACDEFENTDPMSVGLKYDEGSKSKSFRLTVIGSDNNSRQMEGEAKGTANVNGLQIVNVEWRDADGKYKIDEIPDFGFMTLLIELKGVDIKSLKEISFRINENIYNGNVQKEKKETSDEVYAAIIRVSVEDLLTQE